ncbi:macro domain-containing protein [Chitinophaga sp. RAB17]|uniref:macro domain-containing protein n=1 Tax=Chitinophaga sp. RAB17 TaxID=3233049 RepID=UPI003F926607
MIEFVTGDFFDYDADIRINTVNCVGVMGAGVALQFKKKFPKMFEEYLRECNLGRVEIGRPHVWIDQGLFNTSPIIINFPTKRHWKKPSEYEYVEKGLAWLRNFLVQYDCKTVTLPALGCGHGGLDWERVKSMIQEYLDDLDNKILVFEPASSTNISISQDDIKELDSLGICKITPDDSSFPSKLNGKAAVEVFVKGNKELLNYSLFSIIIDPKASEREKKAILSSIDTVPVNNDYTFLMAYNSSFEIDLIKTMIEKKFKVVLLLPYGIINLKLRKDLMDIWDDKKAAVVSISKPHQSWSGIESIKALKFRLKISTTVLITNLTLEFLSKIEKEFSESSTSFFYLNYWNEKPDFFNRIHANPIGRDKVTNKPNMSIFNKIPTKLT